MPCVPASNVHFVSAEDQLSTKRRPKSAQPSPTKSYGDYGPTINKKRQQCLALFRLRDPLRVSLTDKPTQIPGPGARRTLLTDKELERMRNAAKYITVEERLAALERQEQLTQQLDIQAERAKKHFKKIDEERLLAQQMQSVQEDENELADQQMLLEKAFIEKHENEEEVKKVNRVILNAKCNAVLDAQMLEKKELERLALEEKHRLEKMVLDVNKRDVESEDCHADLQKQRNAQYAREIREQLHEREELKFLESERIEEEARAQKLANEAYKREEERQAMEAWQRRQKFREELDRVVEMSNLFKKMLNEQETEAERRIEMYLAEKREREKQLEHEKQLAKEEFERKQQQLYTLAEKRRDSQSQREDAILVREQERVEREYRKKEHDAALRKKQIEHEMKEARERQLEEIKSRQALQIAREEKAFNALIDSLKREEERMRKQEEEHALQRKCYRNAIIRQIGDKVMAKRRMNEDERTSANLWRKAERQRLDNIKMVVKAKLMAMREACLPQRYIRDVERQLDRIIKTIQND